MRLHRRHVEVCDNLQMVAIERARSRIVPAALAVAVLNAAYIGALLLLSEPLAKPFSFLALVAVMLASAAVVVWRAANLARAPSLLPGLQAEYHHIVAALRVAFADPTT